MAEMKKENKSESAILMKDVKNTSKEKETSSKNKTAEQGNKDADREDSD